MSLRLPTGWLACFCATLAGCTELCVPTETRLGFFSQGDCVLTKASFFQGHEWITYLGNEDLETSDRFTPSELIEIADGNRRVDWPKELLVQLNASPVAYVSAITEYTDRAENQKMHFLLTDVNRTPEAVADSLAEMKRLSVEAVRGWSRERSRALSLVGRATHILQDSFSRAHADRDADRDNCIVSVKAYIPRAAAADNTGVAFHGGREIDTIGHTTTEDSIYREGRECHEPEGRAAVEACLNGPATRARRATRDYLALVHRAVARAIQAVGDPSEEALLEEDFVAYADQHFRLCEEIPAE